MRASTARNVITSKPHDFDTQICVQHLDRFGKMLVSALVMAGGAVVMLLYAEGRHADENIRLFLVEIAEHYMKV